MAYIHKPNSHNWYYCVEADNPILQSQVPDELRCNWLSYSVGKLWDETYKSAEDYAGLMETTVGKWTIFPEGGNVDGLWPKLLGATATGILEVEIKASTSYRKGKKLICVYTYDELDKEDTDRV